MFQTLSQKLCLKNVRLLFTGSALSGFSLDARYCGTLPGVIDFGAFFSSLDFNVFVGSSCKYDLSFFSGIFFTT